MAARIRVRPTRQLIRCFRIWASYAEATAVERLERVRLTPGQEKEIEGQAVALSALVGFWHFRPVDGLLL
jgi:hypothetical protein